MVVITTLYLLVDVLLEIGGVYSQSTQSKNTHQGELLFSGELKRLEDGHWE